MAIKIRRDMNAGAAAAASRAGGRGKKAIEDAQTLASLAGRSGGGGSTTGATAQAHAQLVNAPTGGAAPLGSVSGQAHAVAPRNYSVTWSPVTSPGGFKKAEAKAAAQAQAERDFRASENQKNRDLQISEAEKNRNFREEQAQAERDAKAVAERDAFERREYERAAQEEARRAEKEEQRRYETEQYEQQTRDRHYMKQGYSFEQARTLQQLDEQYGAIDMNDGFTPEQKEQAKAEVDAKRAAIKPIYAPEKPPKPNVQEIDGVKYVQNGNSWERIEPVAKPERRLTINDVLKNVPTKRFDADGEEVEISLDERLDMAQKILDRIYGVPSAAGGAEPGVGGTEPGMDPMAAMRLLDPLALYGGTQQIMADIRNRPPAQPQVTQPAVTTDERKNKWSKYAD